MKNRVDYLLYFLMVVLISLILFSSIIIVAYTQSTSSSDTWETMASMPTARANLGIAVANGKIYAIGGSARDPVTGSPVLLNVTEEYDPATNTWTTKASMPTARHSFGIAVYQNKIYCIGGSVNGPTLAVNEVYDPATNTWDTKTPMPTARAALSANTVNDRIYLMGGNPKNTTNVAYDPITDSWSTKAQLPMAIVYSESVAVYNKIYVFGGLSHRKSTQIYDTETNTWTVGAPMPTGVAEGAAVATTGENAPVRIYVMGGETTYIKNGATFGNITDLNQVYDPESNTWTTEAPLPTELRFFGLAAANDTLYAIGGLPRTIIFLNTNYKYVPIDYGQSGQEPNPPFENYVYVALVATAIAVIAVAILTILHKRG